MRLISGYHLLQQTAFVIELGLNAFLLVLAAYFHLRWDRLSLGIFLGLSVPACVHLATWAVMANAGSSEGTAPYLIFSTWPLLTSVSSSCCTP